MPYEISSMNQSRLNIQKAQQQANALLKQKLVDFCDKRYVEAYAHGFRLPGDKSVAAIARAVTPPFSSLKSVEDEATPIPFEELTVKDYLLQCVRDDYFLPIRSIEVLQEAANTDTRSLDIVMNARVSDLEPKDERKNTINLLLALDLLAKEGTVPKRNSFREGLGVLQRKLRRHESEAAKEEMARHSLTAHKDFLNSGTVGVITQLCLEWNNFPPYITGDMQKKIREAFTRNEDGVLPPHKRQERGDIRRELEILVAEQEKFSPGLHTMASQSANTSADEARCHLEVQKTVVEKLQEIAANLGIKPEKPRQPGG
jgi:hypothetical protein